MCGHPKFAHRSFYFDEMQDKLILKFIFREWFLKIKIMDSTDRKSRHVVENNKISKDSTFSTNAMLRK